MRKGVIGALFVVALLGLGEALAVRRAQRLADVWGAVTDPL